MNDLIEKIQAKWNELQNATEETFEFVELELWNLLAREPVSDKKGSFWKDKCRKAVIVRKPDGSKRVLVPLGSVECPVLEVCEYLEASQKPLVDRRKPFKVEYLGKKYRIVPRLSPSGHSRCWGVIPESTGIPLVLKDYPTTKEAAEDEAYKHARGKRFLVTPESVKQMETIYEPYLAKGAGWDVANHLEDKARGHGPEGF